MVMDNLNFQMVNRTKGTTITTRSMVMAYSSGPMVRDMKDGGQMANKMVMEY